MVNPELFKNLYSIEYHYSNEELDNVITNPISVEEDDKGNHIITEDDGLIWFIKPTWDFFLIRKRMDRS